MLTRFLCLLLASATALVVLPAIGAEPLVIYRATSSVVIPAATNIPMTIEKSGSTSVAYGAAWDLTFSTKNGKAPFTATLTGTQPSKVVIANDGGSIAFSGSAYEGTWGPFVATIKDSSVPPVQTTASASVVVAPAAQAMAVSAPSAASLAVAGGASWNVQVTASGGKAPYTFEPVVGLPAGVATSQAGAVLTISGTGASGTYPGLKIAAADAAGKRVETAAFTVVAAASPKYMAWGNSYGAPPVPLASNVDLVKFGVVNNDSYGLAANGNVYRWTTDLSASATAAYTGYSDWSESLQLMCGIKSSQTFCWGAPTGGNGTNGSATNQVANDPGLSKIYPGYYGTCGLTSAGAAWCWGYWYMSGDGANYKTTFLSKVVDNHPFSKLTVGQTHVCGLDTVGKAWCWGDNTYGQLGVPVATKNSPRPIAVAGSYTFTQIMNSGYSTCGLKSDGQLICWGENDYGQFGNGTTSRTDVPTAAFGTYRFDTAIGGANIYCGVTTAGDAYCAGRNVGGAVGNTASPTNTVSPIQVPLGGRAVSMIMENSTISAGMIVKMR